VQGDFNKNLFQQVLPSIAASTAVSDFKYSTQFIHGVMALGNETFWNSFLLFSSVGIFFFFCSSSFSRFAHKRKI
jgi:hypothetical protein